MSQSGATRDIIRRFGDVEARVRLLWNKECKRKDQIDDAVADKVDDSDPRLTDCRTPCDGTVTDPKVSASAAISESKLNLASDAAPGTPSRRSLGTTATQAAPGTLVNTVSDLAAEVALKQPLDSDLTSIAALSTTSFGRSLLTQTDAAAARTTLSAQTLNAQLTAISALSTTPFGRSVLEQADAAAVRFLIGASGVGHTHAQSDVTNLVSDLALKAPLASPVFTGVVTARDSIDLRDAGVNGALTLVQGTATQTGYIEFWRPSDGSRLGYIGYANSGIYMDPEIGPVTIAGELQTDTAIAANGTSKHVEIGVDRIGGGQAQINFGSTQDTNLYRHAADVLRTDDAFVAGKDIDANFGAASQVIVGYFNGALGAGITFGNGLDANLHRVAAGQLGTDSNFHIVGGSRALCHHNGSTSGEYLGGVWGGQV